MYWSEIFKKQFQYFHDEWKNSTPTNNNGKLPTNLQTAVWIKKAWAEISIQLVTESFKSSGISNEIHGLEDDSIKCLEIIPEERFVDKKFLKKGLLIKP